MSLRNTFIPRTAEILSDCLGHRQSDQLKRLHKLRKDKKYKDINKRDEPKHIVDMWEKEKEAENRKREEKEERRETENE